MELLGNNCNILLRIWAIFYIITRYIVYYAPCNCIAKSFYYEQIALAIWIKKLHSASIWQVLWHI